MYNATNNTLLQNLISDTGSSIENVQLATGLLGQTEKSKSQVHCSLQTHSTSETYVTPLCEALNSTKKHQIFLALISNTRLL